MESKPVPDLADAAVLVDSSVDLANSGESHWETRSAFISAA
jgi:hypothetical protein